MNGQWGGRPPGPSGWGQSAQDSTQVLGRVPASPEPERPPAGRPIAEVFVAPVGRQALPVRRRGLQWLIAIPTLLALPVPLYNRIEPTLFGLPFFYWYQLAIVVLMIVVVTLVHLLTKGRRPRWTR